MAEGTISERAPRQVFGAGWMIGTSLSVWLATVRVWLPVMAVAFLPLALLRIWWVERLLSDVPPSGASEILLRVLNWLALLGGGTVTSAVLCYAVVRRLQGQPVAFAEALRRGSARLPHAFGIGLVYAAIAIALVLFSTLLGAAAGDFVVVFCAISALSLLVGLGLSLPAAVTEKLPVGASLRRSLELTRGSRGWLFLAWFLLLLVMSILLGLVLGVTIYRPQPHGGSHEQWADLARREAWLVTGILGLICSLLAVSVGVAYFGLRRDRDGSTYDELVKAFE